MQAAQFQTSVLQAYDSHYLYRANRRDNLNRRYRIVSLFIIQND